ncbi:MAG: hypothetical protein V3V00_16125 [Saprospiraceae bacterium]
MGNAKALMVVPPGYRVGTAVIDGEATSVFIAKTHRKSLKTPKATRDRIRARMKEIRIPVLSIGANIIPIVQTGDWLFNIMPLKGYSSQYKAAALFNRAVSPYTGLKVDGQTFKTSFDFSELNKGLIPNVIVWGINKLGVFKSLNQKIARTRLPVRLN